MFSFIVYLVVNFYSVLRWIGAYLYLLEDEKSNEYLKKLESDLNSQIVHTRMMNWNELNECTHFGISIGSHTHNHATLTRLSEPNLKFEMEYSRNLIREKIHSSDCLSLAFPNGKYNESVAQIALNLGYKYLLSTEATSISNYRLNEVLPRYSLYNKEWWKNAIKLLYIYHMK